MSTNCIITNAFYKASNCINNESVLDLTQLPTTINEKPSFQMLIFTDGKASYFSNDNTPSLGIMPLPIYRIAINSKIPFKVFPVGYVKSNNDCLYADIIGDEINKYYSADVPICLYIESEKPLEKSGNYEIEIKVFVKTGLNDEQLLTTKTITLIVHNVVLDNPNNNHLYLDLWQHTSNIARTFEVQTYSEEHFKKIKQVFEMLSELGQKSVTIVASDAPWRGWGCYLMRDYPANLFEYNIVGIYKRNNQFVYDYTNLDKYIELAEKAGIKGDISIYGLLGIWMMPYFQVKAPDYPEAIMLRYQAEDGRYCYIQETEEIKQYIENLFNHLKAIGVWDRVRIAADEPSNLEAFDKNLEILKSIAPDIKLKMAIDKESVVATHSNLLADIAYSFPCALNATTKTNQRRLWYICNVPNRPNSLLENSLMDTFILAPLNYYLDFDGILRWSFTCWTAEPLKDIRYNVNGIPAGDMYLIYPSKSGNLLPSLRYKAFQKGIIFYELLIRLKKSGHIAEASNILSLIICNKEKQKFVKVSEDIYYSNSATDFLNAYQKLLQIIEKEGV